jgi:predicted phage gp36 major capsid-like protein
MMGRFSAILFLVLGLAACETTSPMPVYPDITFTHLKQIKLDVGAVDYVQAFVPPAKLPNVDHLFPLRPSVVAKCWTDDRLAAVGPISRIARVTLINAAVMGSALDTTQGLKGVFTVDQAARYDATVEILIEIINSQGVVEGKITATAQRSQTAPENITLNDRDQLWFELTEAVMGDLDRELEATIRKYLAKYVR